MEYYNTKVWKDIKEVKDVVMKNKPNISIIIPTYNRAATIGKTIDTFIAQTYKDWEMIVVDDHSKDNTKEVIDEYHKRDARISYMLNERKKGAQGARNTGILHAQADWVVLFDSDDYVYPNFLERMVSYCVDGNDVITCYARKIDVNEGPLETLLWGGEGNIEWNLMHSENYVNFDDCIFRKSKLFEIGLLDENCPAYQEYDTHIRLSRVSNYKWVKEVLMDYMWGGGDTMSVNQKNNGKGLNYVLWHNHKRWKEIAYDEYHAMLIRLYRSNPLKMRIKFILSDPALLLNVPGIYYQRVKNRIKGLFKKK